MLPAWDLDRPYPWSEDVVGNNVVVEKKGFFSRLMSSVGGVVIGILLVLIAFPVLFFNEGRAVRSARGLAEGAASVKSVDARQVDPSNDGALVHLTGEATAAGVLRDEIFPIETAGLGLTRTVEMYQWVEDSKRRSQEKLGGSEETTTTFSYRQQWKEGRIDSARFHDKTHQNPELPFESDTWFASDVTLGAFTLDDALTRQLSGWEELKVEASATDLASWEGKHARPISIQEGAVIYGDHRNPQVGDVRIFYKTIKPQTVSVVAGQQGTQLASYSTGAGTSIALLSRGSKSADDMLSAAVSANNTFTWVLRLLGFAMMFGGFSMILGPVAILASILPPLAKLVRAGRAVLAGAAAAGLSLITIAVGWIFYRPLIGLALLAVAVAIIGGGVFFLRSRASSRAEAA